MILTQNYAVRWWCKSLRAARVSPVCSLARATQLAEMLKLDPDVLRIECAHALGEDLAFDWQRPQFVGED